MLAGKVKQSLASVRPSVRLFHNPLRRLNRLTFELAFLCVVTHDHSSPGIRVKVIGQGQRSMSSTYGHGNAVTQSVPPRSRTVFLVQSTAISDRWRWMLQS